MDIKKINEVNKKDEVNYKNKPREEFRRILKYTDYEKPEYIINIMKLLKDSNEVQDMFNELFEKDEDNSRMTQIFIRMEKSLDALLKEKNYEEIKDFIKIYTKAKYNPKINASFAQKIYMTRGIKVKKIVTLMREHFIIGRMENKMGDKLKEYAEQNYDGFIEYIKEISEFIIGENEYWNNRHMSLEVLPEIMGIKDILNSDNYVNIECKHDVKSLLRYLNYLKRRCNKKQNDIKEKIHE